jgi:glycosyltransferase involved in cell wall biosynthesis
MKTSQTKLRALFFANIPIENEERSIGGATVLAKNILDFILLDNRVHVVHVQIRSFWRNKLQLLDYCKWIVMFPFYLKNVDVVSFHGTKDYHFTIAPILWIWARLFKKRISYHFFGGNFHEQYEAAPKIVKYLFNKTILNSNTVFFETLEMIKYFKKKGLRNCIWLPNSRKPFTGVTPRKEFTNKFVFISRVIPQKGIDEIIKAANNLLEEYTIDIYGPIDDRHYNSDLFKVSKATYKGLLNPKDVMATLSNYDVLLLPSYFVGEGYPGIIIEALSLAIPVITTHWKALPEIITNDYNGILIETKNAQQLEQAILCFNSDNYTRYSENALESFKKFNSDLVFNKFVESYLL